MDHSPPRPLSQAEDGGPPRDERSSPSRSSQLKPTRSRKGCYSCRKRKVKCDETPPVCRNCKIGDRQCHWPPIDEVPRNKRRRQSSTPLSPYHQQHAPRRSEQAFHRDGIANVLNLLEEREHFSQPPPRHSEPIASPFGQTNGTPILPWPIPHAPAPIPRPAEHPRKPEVDRGPTIGDGGEFIDADGFSDLLIATDRQAELMADPAFLQPYFPNVNDRLVVRHYLYHTVKVIMAFDSPKHPWNPWISIHAAAAFRHLPGISPANDALRTAILAVGAVHMRYGHDRSDAVRAWRITHQARTRVLGLVKQSNVWMNHGTKKDDEDELELVLAALLSCMIASSLAADDSWSELLTIVLGLIERLGGAHQILRHSSRDRMSLRRFVIEQLATRDVFGCMTTDLAPRILTSSFAPLFFEAERWSRRESEWESVESMFGMSRRLVEIIARFCRLVAKVRHHDYRILEDGDSSKPIKDLSNISLRLPDRVTARLSSTPTSLPALAAAHRTAESDSRPSSSARASPSANLPASSSEPHRLTVQREANNLLDELKNWDSAYTFIPLHPRTQYGNHAYWHALRLRLLREIFRVPREDKRIAEAVSAIMEISREMLSLYGRIVWMTWPILIAGFNMAPDDPSRTAALEFLCEFEPHACFDNAAACRTLFEYWKYNDSAEGDALPSEVFRKLQSRPFLD